MKVAIFGAGTMGRGIAQVFAANGHTALMYASSIASAQRHKEQLDASLQSGWPRANVPGHQGRSDGQCLVEEESAAADADLVIECIAEEMGVPKGGCPPPGGGAARGGSFFLPFLFPKKKFFHPLEEL